MFNQYCHTSEIWNKLQPTNCSWSWQWRLKFTMNYRVAQAVEICYYWYCWECVYWYHDIVLNWYHSGLKWITANELRLKLTINCTSGLQGKLKLTMKCTVAQAVGIWCQQYWWGCLYWHHKDCWIGTIKIWNELQSIEAYNRLQVKLTMNCSWGLQWISSCWNWGSSVSLEMVVLAMYRWLNWHHWDLKWMTANKLHLKLAVKVYNKSWGLQWITL